jgi:hypothetical protein
VDVDEMVRALAVAFGTAAGNTAVRDAGERFKELVARRLGGRVPTAFEDPQPSSGEWRDAVRKALEESGTATDGDVHAAAREVLNLHQTSVVTGGMSFSGTFTNAKIVFNQSPSDKPAAPRA